MSVKEEAGSGAPAGESGAKPETPKTEEVVQPSISVKDHKRALDDLHKYKNEVKELREAKNKVETERMAEQENWKGLYEKSNADLEEVTSKNQKLNSSVLYNEKYRAVHEAAIKLGLKPEAVSDLDNLKLEEVSTELTTEGRILVHGAEDYAKSLVKIKSHWFSSSDVPVVNSGGSTLHKAKDEVLSSREYGLQESRLRREGKTAAVRELNSRYLNQRLPKIRQS